MNEQDQHSAAFGYAYIEAGVVGCFSRRDLVVEIKFSETGRVAANIVRDQMMQTVVLERAEAEHFLTKVVEAARQPEVHSGERSTTWYYAKARWRNLSFVAGGALGGVDVKSSDLSPEEIELLALHCKDEVISEQARELLAKGLHRPAIEIYREAEAFTKAKSYLAEGSE